MSDQKKKCVNLLFILRIKVILTKNNRKIFSGRNESPNWRFSVSMVTRLAPNLYDVTKTFYQQAHYGVLLPLGNQNVSPILLVVMTTVVTTNGRVTGVNRHARTSTA